MISETALDRLHELVTAPDLSGTRYELVSLLGRGGMATVYLARDTTLVVRRLCGRLGPHGGDIVEEREYPCLDRR